MVLACGCVCMYRRRCTEFSLEKARRQHRVSSPIIYTLVFETRSLQNLATVSLARQIGQPPVSKSPELGLQTCTATPGFFFYMGSGDLNAGPHACVASTSQTEYLWSSTPLTVKAPALEQIAVRRRFTSHLTGDKNHRKGTPLSSHITRTSPHSQGVPAPSLPLKT